MTEKQKQVQATAVETDRRGFLKLASIGTVASGAALLTGEAATAKEADAETTAEGSGGYKETKHVKTFYDSARF
jgi:hypothetical protein